MIPKPKTDLHVHISNFSPTLNQAVDTLIERGVFKTKTELIRAGIRNILQTYKVV